MKEKTFGENATECLIDIETAFWEREYEHPNTPSHFPLEALPASVKILMFILMDTMWRKQSLSEMSMEDRNKEVEACGAELRAFILKYTGQDSHSFYK